MNFEKIRIICEEIASLSKEEDTKYKELDDIHRLNNDLNRDLSELRNKITTLQKDLNKEIHKKGNK